ncbi:MAG TPA: tyrosine-protein phosphatase [Chthonomonadaceae bacterium]|nr:tyrosine-protein phosphatase [Chthonomonadaceae bacterium]
MKQFWGCLCVTLSVIPLTIAQVALGEDAGPGAKPAAPTVASVEARLKEAWPTSSAPTHPIKAEGVRNFGKLNDNIWRSGQPTREGYALLAKEGLKTVINLREEFPQDKDLLPQGVNYVYIPIKDEHAPTEEQAKKLMETVSNPDNWPILIHCEGGQGRAGTMSALIRHSMDGWDNTKIMKEVGNFRLKYLGLIKLRMASCQQQFIQHWEETPSLCQLPQDKVAQPQEKQDQTVR